MKRWIERQKNVIDFTLSSLFRRKGKNAALILVYTLVVFMAASVVFTVPIIIAFFFAQKTFIQGIKLTGSKE